MLEAWSRKRKKKVEIQGKQKKEVTREENITRKTEREEQKKKRKVFYGAHGIDL